MELEFVGNGNMGVIELLLYRRIPTIPTCYCLIYRCVLPVEPTAAHLHKN